MNTGRSLTQEEIDALLAQSSRKFLTQSASYMILADGSKVPFDSVSAGRFVSSSDKRRKYMPGSNDVIAYKAKP